MDSSKNPSTSSKKEISINVQSKRGKFLSSYRRHQTLSLPDSIIYYISKNPSSAKLYGKLVQSCKYFFLKNPILIVPYLRFRYGKISGFDDDDKFVDVNNTTIQIWIRDKFLIENGTAAKSISSLLPKFYHCGAKELTLSNSNISVNDFILLSSKCQKISLKCVIITKEDDTALYLDKIFQLLPNSVIEFICHLDYHASRMFTAEILHQLVDISHFSNLQIFSLFDIPETFDLDTFNDYMKKNKKTKIFLRFSNQISEQYKARLQSIVNEILSTEEHEYRPPCFAFVGIPRSKEDQLQQLFHQYYHFSV